MKMPTFQSGCFRINPGPFDCFRIEISADALPRASGFCCLDQFHSRSAERIPHKGLSHRTSDSNHAGSQRGVGSSGNSGPPIGKSRVRGESRADFQGFLLFVGVKFGRPQSPARVIQEFRCKLKNRLCHGPDKGPLMPLGDKFNPVSHGSLREGPKQFAGASVGQQPSELFRFS